jgi:hypothetical protein
MTPDQFEHYRRLCKTHQLNRDPLIVVRVSDLVDLLDAFEGKKPKIQVKAHACT